MNSTDFSSTLYKNPEHQAPDDKTGVGRIHDATEVLALQTSQEKEEDYELLIKSNKEKERLLSETHLKVKEEKVKPSWIHVLKARLTLLRESPVFLASMASLSISMNGFIVKILSRKYSVFQILSTRGVGALVIGLITMFWKGISPLGPKDKIPPLLLRGIIGAVTIICAWSAINLLPLSEAAFLRNSHPIATAILASLIGMEKLNWMTWLGIAGTAVGNALVAHPPFIFGGHQEWGIARIVGLAISAVCVLFIGLNTIIVKKIGKSVHPFVHLVYQLSFSLILSIPFLSASYPMKTKLPEGPLDWVLLFVLSLGAISNQALVVSALQRGSPTLVAAVLMTNMIYASLLGFFVLSERFSLVSGTGAFIILISVFVVIFGRGLSKKQEYKALPQIDPSKEIELEPVSDELNRPNENFNESVQ